MNCKVLISIAQTHINTLQSLKSYSYFFASIALCFSSGAQIGHELDRMFKAKMYFMIEWKIIIQIFHQNLTKMLKNKGYF